MKDKLEIGQTVYFTAFPKNSQEKYICRGVITKIPQSNREPYRVQINAASSVSVTGVSLEDRRLLIHRAITKYYSELSANLGPILAPKTWIT